MDQEMNTILNDAKNDEISKPEQETETGDFHVIYNQENLIYDDYSNQLKDYFREFDGDPNNDKEETAITFNSKETPLVETIFTDYIHMVVKQLVSDAGSLFQEYEVDGENIYECRKKYGVPADSILRNNTSLMIPEQTFLVKQRTFITRNGDTLNHIKNRLNISISHLLEDIGDTASILKQGTSFFCKSYEFFSNGIDKKLMAALFYVRWHQNNITTYYQEYMNDIFIQIEEYFNKKQKSVKITWECDGTDSFSISLTKDNKILEWDILPGDTAERIAKMWAVYHQAEQVDLMWDQFYKSIKPLNTSDFKDNFDFEDTFTLPDTTLSVDGDETIGKLFRRIYPDKPDGDFSGNPLFDSPIIKDSFAMKISNTAYHTESPMEVLELMNQFDLSFEELGISIELAEGGLKITKGQKIVIKDAESIPKEELLQEMTKETSVKDMASMSSRFLMQGLRLPKPKDMKDSSTEAYYKMLKQQTVYKKDGKDKILSVHGAQPECNWIQESIEMEMSDERIGNYLPDLSYDWETSLTIPETPLIDSFTSISKAYPVFENTVWRRNSGNRTLYKYNQELINEVSKVRMLTLNTQEEEKEINFRNALLLPFQISLNEKKPNLYSLYGSDSNDRLILEQLLACGRKANSFLDLKYHFLYIPSPLSGIENSYIEIDLKEKESMILKTNLSKETHMFPVLTRTVEPYVANLSLYEDFLKLLWECSVVGGGGYFFYMAASDGSALPKDIFDDDKMGTLYLLVEDCENQSLKNAGIVNYGFCEGASQWENPVSFYEKDESNQELKIWRPSLPVGRYGVQFTMNMPEEEIPDEIEPETASLTTNPNRYQMEDMFNIFSCRVSFDGMIEDKKDSKPLVPLSNENEDTNKWNYMPVFPLYKFYTDQNNPYSIIGQKAEIYLFCRDILGNFAIGKQLYKKLCDITPDYNDFVIAPNEWPGIQFVYFIQKIENQAYLNIELDYKPIEKSNPDIINQLQLSILQLEQEYVHNEYCPIFVDSTLFALERVLSDIDFRNMIEFLNHLLNHLNGQTLNMPDKVSLAFPIAETDSKGELFPLTVSMKIKRRHVHSEVKAAKEATSNISPRIIASSNETEASEVITLTDFTKDFEHALPSLKLANSGETDKELHVIRFGKEGVIKNIKIKPFIDSQYGMKTPKYYALRPLSNQFITRAVSVSSLEALDKKEILQQHVFSNIDLDLWGKRFLEDYESFLSLEYADQLVLHDVNDVNELIGIKESLANAIAKQMILIENKQNGINTHPERIIKDRLKRSLTSAYSISSIGEYELECSCTNRIRMTTAPERTVNEGKESDNLVIQTSKIDSKEKTFCVIYQSQNPNATGFDVNLNLNINEFEYDINDDEYHSEYESSKWLKFIIPISNETMGQYIDISLETNVLVPNPLRVCPLPPSLTEHKKQSKPFKERKELHQYTYQLDSKLKAAEQDVYQYLIKFSDDKATRNAVDPYALFDALAQYDYVRDDLLSLISHQKKLLRTFIQLAHRIATAWNNNNISNSRLFRNKDEILNLNVHFKEDKFRLDPVAEGWNVELSDMEPTISGDMWEFSILVKDVDIYTKHSVEPSIKTIRNQNILQASDNYLEVNPIFIYQTETKTLNRIFISNRSREEIIVGNLNKPMDKISILESLNLLHKELEIKDLEYTANIVVWYSYVLDKNGNEIIIKLPVTMYNGFIAKDLEGNQEITDNIYNWFQTTNPEELKNGLIFDLTIYTPNQKRVLVNYNNLRINFSPMKTVLL